MKKNLSLVFILFVLVILNLCSYAQSVTLNTAFGNNGATLIPFIDFDAVFPGGILLQGNKTLAASTSNRDEYGYTGLITRLNTNGTVDTSFAENGSIYVCNHAYACFLRSFVLQPDGKIVTLAKTQPHTDDPHDVVWLQRFLQNGKPDSSFGTNGNVLISKEYTDASAKYLAIKPDDKIVISAIINGVFYIGQFFSNGIPDNSFGDGGVITSKNNLRW